MDMNSYIMKKMIVNIPKVHNTIKIKLEDYSIKLMEDILYSYYNVGNIRKKYILECLVDVSMIDYFIRYFNDNKIINQKICIDVIKRLTSIKNIIYSWRNNEENK